MHALFFGTKRAFHATLRILRKPMKTFGLTPARFDLLYLMSDVNYANQSELRKYLGVTTPTVSRMVTALQALGFVHAERSPYDRRQRLVRITKLGLERIRAAIECFIERRLGLRILDRAFRPLSMARMRWKDALFLRMCEYEELLRCVRNMCGDTAKLHYPWHPDD
jgi:DNA-binding MarR family transcriptional regulator